MDNLQEGMMHIGRMARYQEYHRSVKDEEKEKRNTNKVRRGFY